jgi:2-polyprenyl-6-methoxyphenol hydroxylase-like FAD-dependent oxidoreductase
MIKTDVIIMGSGISGLVLSILLQRKQIPHIVLDRIQKQKVMALAETLPPSAMPLLEELDLLSLFEQAALRKTYGYHSVWGSKQLRTTHFFNSNPYKYGLKIDKQAVQNTLKELVDTHIISYDTLDTIDTTPEKTTVIVHHQKEKQHIQGKIIVDATGRNRAVLSALQIPIQQYDDLLSFSCHLPRVTHKHLVHDVLTESFAGGWGIISGLRENVQVMTLYTNKHTGLHKQLTDYAHWKPILSDTKYLRKFLAKEVPDTILGGKASSSAPQYTAGRNWLAIGDAAMAFDPLSSHGITNALYTAKRAAQALTQPLYTLENYHQDIHDIFTSYLDTKDILYQQEQRWPEQVFWQEYKLV